MTDITGSKEETPIKEGSAGVADSASTPPATEKAQTGGFWKGLRKFLFIAVYAAILIGLVIGILAGVEYYAYLQVKNSPLGKAYQHGNLDRARRSSQKVAPHFGYEPTPGFAATRNIRLGNAYEYINEESFKDFREVPREKPKDEFRVIVTGGSVVYGRGPVPPADKVADFYEVTFRWTIPHIMEKLLNADPRVKEKTGGKTVRVINAGVAGHVIQHDLMRYLAKLRLLEPDVVVSLDGANEVHTVARPLKDWNYFHEGPYYQVIIDTMSMSTRGIKNYLALWLKRNTYFFTWLALQRGEGTGILNENIGFAAHPMDPTPEMLKARDRNIQQVADVSAIYHRTLQTDGVPHVFALQPMFANSKKKRTPMEERIAQVTGMLKIGFYDAVETYDILVDRIKKRCKEEDLEVVDLTTIYDNVTKWVFTDWCHLTNGANYILAKRLANEVKTQLLGLPLLKNDPLAQPPDSYFDDYSKHAKVLVNGKLTDEGMRILKGYPGKELLEAQLSAPDRPSSVTLDLGKVLPLSRMRIVWGDKDSVPKSWKMEISEDGTTWKEWLTMARTETDPYDQWPGYEHYLPEETSARYVKYTRTGDGANAPIKLRQLSLFR